MLSKDKLIYDGTTPADGDSVAAFLHATNKLASAAVNSNESLYTIAALNDGTGTAITSTAGTGAYTGKQGIDVSLISPISVAVDLNGIYDVSTNPTPDNVGLITFSRAASPGLSDQIQKNTGAAASSDSVVAANVHGQDVNAFGMIFNGTTWDRMRGTAGVVDVNATSAVADDAVDSGNPMKVGSRAAFGSLLAAISTTGDRADLISDDYRRIWVNMAPNAGGSNAAVAVDTTVGGVPLFATPLAGRQRVTVQNLSANKAIYLGFGTVSAANGIRVAGGATWTEMLGKNQVLKAIAESGSQDVRVLQLA